mmetsp:Transcript_12242/g.18586  ORF Transcript_12242/g.18586 Transcript_12242/m.18586 type:complete len:249 (-) Transcript_12242:695-1441(-)
MKKIVLILSYFKLRFVIQQHPLWKHKIALSFFLLLMIVTIIFIVFLFTGKKLVLLALGMYIREKRGPGGRGTITAVIPSLSSTTIRIHCDVFFYYSLEVVVFSHHILPLLATSTSSSIPFVFVDDGSIMVRDWMLFTNSVKVRVIDIINFDFYLAPAITGKIPGSTSTTKLLTTTGTFTPHECCQMGHASEEQWVKVRASIRTLRNTFKTPSSNLSVETLVVTEIEVCLGNTFDEFDFISNDPRPSVW